MLNNKFTKLFCLLATAVAFSTKFTLAVKKDGSSSTEEDAAQLALEERMDFVLRFETFLKNDPGIAAIKADPKHGYRKHYQIAMEIYNSEFATLSDKVSIARDVEDLLSSDLATKSTDPLYQFFAAFQKACRSLNEDRVLVFTDWVFAHPKDDFETKTLGSLPGAHSVSPLSDDMVRHLNHQRREMEIFLNKMKLLKKESIDLKKELVQGDLFNVAQTNICIIEYLENFIEKSGIFRLYPVLKRLEDQNKDWVDLSVEDFSDKGFGTFFREAYSFVFNNPHTPMHSPKLDAFTLQKEVLQCFVNSLQESFDNSIAKNEGLLILDPTTPQRFEDGLGFLLGLIAVADQEQNLDIALDIYKEVCKKSRENLPLWFKYLAVVTDDEFLEKISTERPDDQPSPNVSRRARSAGAGAAGGQRRVRFYSIPDDEQGVGASAGSDASPQQATPGHRSQE